MAACEKKYGMFWYRCASSPAPPPLEERERGRENQGIYSRPKEKHDGKVSHDLLRVQHTKVWKCHDL